MEFWPVLIQDIYIDKSLNHKFFNKVEWQEKSIESTEKPVQQGEATTKFSHYR